MKAFSDLDILKHSSLHPGFYLFDTKFEGPATLQKTEGKNALLKDTRSLGVELGKTLTTLNIQPHTLLGNNLKLTLLLAGLSDYKAWSNPTLLTSSDTGPREADIESC